MIRAGSHALVRLFLKFAAFIFFQKLIMVECRDWSHINVFDLYFPLNLLKLALRPIIFLPSYSLLYFGDMVLNYLITILLITPFIKQLNNIDQVITSLIIGDIVNKSYLNNLGKV